MSAIFGILRFDGREVASADMERIADKLTHRGPDGRAFVADGAIGLGHCLMRTNVEDQFEAQPLYDREAGITLVADLRIDNRDELAAALGIEAAELGGLADSALALAAYKRWGEGCAEHLLGDFVIAVWDGRARKLVLIRDHTGQRGVYFHRGEDFFAFAPEVRALWSCPGVPRTLSDAAIGRMLMHDMSPHEGATPYDGIEGFGGGTVLTVQADGGIEKRRYWEPHADPAHEGKDEAYYVAAYRRVLGEAVACRLRRVAGSPGIIFSGGYDSAAIAGLAGDVLKTGGRKLVAVSSVMPADYVGTIRHARRWVEMCARDMPWLDVHYVTREGKDALGGLEKRLIERETPSLNYAFVQDELCAALAAAGARLIMDGHGGDYTLNPRGQAALARFLATGPLRRFGREFRAHLRLSGHSLWQTLKSDLAGMLMPPAVVTLWKRIVRGRTPLWGDQPVATAFAGELIANGTVDPRNLRIAACAETAMRASLLRTLARVCSTPTPGIGLEAARHGLELTRPFHDKRVVELALAVPEDLYLKNGRNRYLACMALKDIYPAEFQTRWRRNDDEIPDFQRMVKTIEPQILAEIAHMEQSETLARYVDFAKIRRLLAVRGADDHNSGWEQETQLALGGFLTARYIAWFRCSNR